MAMVAVPAMLAIHPRALAAPPPPPRIPAPHTLRAESEIPSMVTLADGSLRYLDADARFVGVIHPDGRVVIRDLPNAEVSASVLGIPVLDWAIGMNRAVDEATRERRPNVEEPQPDPHSRVDQAEAAAEKIPHGPYGPPPILLSIGVKFGGIADRLLRKGQRKRSKAKKSFLDATAPLRDAMARQHARQRERRALLGLGQQLATLWRDESRSITERKRAIFERWDECIEARADAGPDEAQHSAGAEQMRRKIERFIRLEAPPGSPEAFSAQELRRLNAGRHSRQRFDPYALHDEARADPEDPGDRRAP